MTFRALRLLRYGRGAVASARPTEGSRLASDSALPGSGNAAQQLAADQTEAHHPKY